MGSDAAALFREAMSLPDDERATLAVKLLGTIGEPAVDDGAEGYQSWLRLIERRLGVLRSGDDPGEGWDEVHEDLVVELGNG